MKKLVGLSLLVALSALGCATRVNPGYMGIKVNYSGTYRGVQDVPIVTGWVPYMPGFSTVLEFPTFVQTGKWEGAESISFNSKEDLVITVAISVSYQIHQDKVPAFYIKFRTDRLEDFTHNFFHNVTRDVFNEVGGTYSVEGLMGPEKEKFLKEVRLRVNAFMSDFGVEVVQLGFIGSPTAPPQVMEQLNAKVAATQAAMKAENQVRQAKAEAQSKIAAAQGSAQAAIEAARGEAQANIERANGQAKANDVIARSITQNVIAWRRLQLQGEWIDAWKAGGANVPTMMAGAGPGFIMDLRSFQEAAAKPKGQ